jgi:hypothetical protein
VPQRWTKRPFQARIMHGPDWRLLSDHFPLVVSTKVPTTRKPRPVRAKARK